MLRKKKSQMRMMSQMRTMTQMRMKRQGEEQGG